MKIPPPAKYRWLDRMQEVDRQHQVTERAVVRLWIAARDGDVRLPPEARFRDVSDLLGADPPAPDPTGVLERTFLIRLFAVFEEACRRCRIERFGRSPEDRIGCERLLAWLPNQPPCWITGEMHRDADTVRDYRNDLIHLDRRHPRVLFRDAKRRLSGFLKGLPEDWQ